MKLQYSHLQPSWTYRRIRDEAHPNPNPVILRGLRAVATSVQAREHLLCEECEDRFSANGESYVGRIAYKRNGDCPIYKQVGHSSTVVTIPDEAHPIMVAADQLDRDKIIYFQASMFWRGSVATHALYREYRLGNRYQEELRRFLLGGPIPENACFTLTVVDQPIDPARFRAHTLFTPPTSEKIAGVFHHYFLCCGLFFHMAIGNLLPSRWREECLSRATPPLIRFSSEDNLGIILNLKQRVASSTLLT